MKQFFLMYESDQVIVQSKTHMYGQANSVKTCRQYIRNIRKNEAQYNPRNFRVYDSYGDIDPATKFVPMVYEEA